MFTEQQKEQLAALGVTKKEWKRALMHFYQTLGYYVVEMGQPGVNVNFALMYTFKPLLQRLQDGEISQELYDALRESRA